MKNSKGFIQIPILITIIAGILVLGGGGYFGVKQYQNYQTQKIGKEQELKKSQDLLVVQQKIAEEEKNNIEKQKQEEQDKQKLEMEKLKNEVEILKNKPPQAIIKEIPAPKIENDLATIIKQWRPQIAYIDCKFVFDGNNMGEQSGSGYILGENTKNGEIALLTNNHVIEVPIHDLSGKSLGITAKPTSCDIRIPGDSQFITVYAEDRIFSSFDKKDVAMVNIKSPTSYMKSTIQNSGGSFCDKEAGLGEKILILGYPGIGDQNDITVTDGIISGYDGNYYEMVTKVWLDSMKSRG